VNALQLEASQSVLERKIRELCPDAPAMPSVKRKVLDYQMLALYVLAKQCNRPGARILEIGTGHGGSGDMLAKAAPLAEILSLTTEPEEAADSEKYWRAQGCSNVSAQVTASWDLLARKDSRRLDMVFVDGDHNRISRDLPWFNRLRTGGLLLCHDYSPQDSRTPSGIVYAELNRMAERLGRPFDVRLVDEGKVGMVGFYRQRGETA
jgi:predicted O-methyltransferase YrrM